MGALMRATDWSQTPLGPVEDWPQSLRTSVALCLACAFPILVWWGPDLVMLYNDDYRSILGGKHPRALGHPGHECWPEIWPIIGPMLARVLAAGEATRAEDLGLFLETDDYPEERYFSFSYSPIRDESGVVRGVFTPVKETTDKVIGERRLRTLRDLAARMPEARDLETVGRLGAEVLAANPYDIPFALLYRASEDGRTAHLVASAGGVEPGSSLAPSEIILNDAGQPRAWSLATVARTGQSARIDGLPERFLALPSGAWAVPPETAMVLPIPVPGTENATAWLVAATSPHKKIDTDYRRFLDGIASQLGAAMADARAHEEERRRAEALAEIDRAKTVFFSNISHEFRTPLTLMLAPLEELLALNGATEEWGQAALLQVAHRNGLRLLKLVNSLLDFSRIEAGRAEASYEPTDLSALTTALVGNFESACDRAGLSLIVDCPPLPEPVYVDPDMWEKIVLNLVSNAFKYTLEGGIEVRLQPANGAAVLTVSDTGCGIPEHEIPRLFERFHRVEGAFGRTHEGTGIGLALTQELVKLHGGILQVESVVGLGSAFTVSLPLGHDHLPPDRLRAGRKLKSTALGAISFVAEALRWLPDADAPVRTVAPFDPNVPAIPPGYAPQPEAVPTYILVADDNADMRDYLRRLLAARYTVETVADGEAALAALRRGRRPDLVLSDVMMPLLDGVDLVRAVRADPALADVPVILLSARAGEEASIAALEAGADDYLVKPFSARELSARVAANIKLSRLRRDFERRTAADLQAITRLHELGNICARPDIDFIEALEKILDAAIALTGADKGKIQLIDPIADRLVIAAQHGFQRPFLEFFAEVRAGEAACGAAMTAANRIIIEDVTQSPIFAGQESLDVLLGADVRAVQSTPLWSSGGHLLGMISTHFTLPHRPSERELRFMDLLARQAADYLERKRADAALRELNDSLECKIAERTRALEAEMAERQRVEAALQQAQRLEVIGQATGGVAHDFNNLLMIVGGNLELLKSGKGERRRVIDRIEQALARGEALTRQLLSFSRRQALQPQLLDLSDWTPKLIELLRPSLRGDIDLQAEVADDVWAVEVDPGELELAVLNLAVNARDAMPRGGRILVVIDNQPLDGRSADGLSGDFVRIAVKDTGTGIASELLPKVFDPFFTTKEVGKGTGLGLSQVHGFARQAGGTALIESRAGEGTIVTLYLPRSRASLSAGELEHANRSRNLANGTILLVEDNDDVAEVTTGMLEGLGYCVVRVNSAQSALDHLEQRGDADLLLSDIVMPGGKNGVDLARIVRKHYPELPLLLSTGYSSAAREAAKDGFPILPKPYRIGALERFIRAALDREQQNHI